MDDTRLEPLDELSTDPLVEDEVAADELWPTPRGPHLPDALGVLPGAAWAFGLLAVVRLAWSVHEANFGPAPELATVAGFVFGAIPSVVAFLLPAALLARHRDATSAARTLLLGTILLAVVEGLRVLSVPLQAVFERLTPGSVETPFLVPSALIYDAATGLLDAFAIANIGLGLAEARRYEDRARAWPVVVAVVLLVILIAVARLVSVSQLPFDQIPMTATVIAYLATTVILGVLSVGVFGYLTATATGGARSAEEPAAGWIVGAFGGWLVMAALGLFAALSLQRPTPESQPLFTNLALLAEAIFAAGYLGLFGGLALGLPSLDPVQDEDEDEDHTFDGEDAQEKEPGDVHAAEAELAIDFEPEAATFEASGR